MWWTTGYKPMGESLAILLNGDVVALCVDRRAELERASDFVGDRAEVPESGRDLFLSLRCALDAGPVDPRKVAWCGFSRLSARRHEGAERELSAPLVDADRLFGEVARTRDDYEIDLAARATMIAEEGFTRLIEDFQIGETESVLVARLEAHLRELGSDDNFVLVSASQKNRAIHPPTDRTIEQGDVLLAEISPSCEGVYTQICRTVTIGPPRRVVEKDFSTLMASLGDGLDACVPGAKVAEVVAAMDRVIADAGFGEYCRPPYMRARGHGLGIGGVLPGDITSSSAEILCEGDFFVLHPNQYLPSSGYLLCGEPLRIEAGGARTVTSAPGELVSIGISRC